MRFSPARLDRAALRRVLVVATLISAAAPIGAAEPYACSPEAKPANLTMALKNLEDVEVRLSDFKGKVMLVNFWATWCGPCRVEMPWFVDLQSRYGKDRVQVVGVSLDDPVRLLKPYVADLKINYPVLQGLGHRDEITMAFGAIRGVPTTFVISREGKLCAKHVGATSRDSYEAQVKGLLGIP
jgi:thiol-disulfide isomerase/thioredoxin